MWRGPCPRMDGWKRMKYKTSGWCVNVGDGIGFGLNFMMTLLGSIDEVEASLCTLGSIKKKFIYVGHKEIGGDGICGSGEVDNDNCGMRLPTVMMVFLLSIVFK